MEYLFDKHKGLFKAFSDAEKREERFEKQFELRKSKRMDANYKKRNLRNVEADWVSFERFPMEEFCIERLQEYIECVKDKNRKINLAGVYGIRKILSQPRMNPIQQVIDSGVILLIKPFMYMDESPQLQYETAWLLINMCTGTTDQVEYIIKRGCLEGLVHMLNSPISEVKEQAIWALGNIATDTSDHRDLLLHPAILPILINTAMSISTPIRLIKKATWALCCICRTLPIPSKSDCLKIIPVFNKALLMHAEIGEYLEDLLQTILIITSTHTLLMDCFIDKEILQTLISFMLDKSSNEACYALKIIGNFFAGNDKQTNAIIKVGGIKVLGTMIKSDEVRLRREAMWSISNLCAGSTGQIEALWKSGIIKSILNRITSEAFEVQKEISWVLFNLVTNDFFYIEELVALGLFEGLMHLIKLDNAKITLACLECIENCLKTGKSDTEAFMNYCRIVDSIGLLNVLESLQGNKNVKIFEKVCKILENYFEFESEYESLIENIKELTPYNI